MEAGALFDLLPVAGAVVTQVITALVLREILWHSRLRQARRQLRAMGNSVRYMGVEEWYAAQQRSLELLQTLLTDEQKQDLTAKGSFTVTGSEGGRYELSLYGAYSLSPAYGRRVSSWCVVPYGTSLPEADVCAAKLLMLTTNEKWFRRIGIESRY